MESMLNKWDYSGVDQVCYSDPNCESYKKAAEFLGDSVEDWGGGTGWAKRYFTNYRNIDGSAHKNVDQVVDLIKYTSSVDNILMRQVLELNPEWRRILENVKKSFKKRFCLVVGTPLVASTRNGLEESVYSSVGTIISDKTIQEIYFNKQDILDYFPSSEYKILEEEVETQQYYNRDWILYVERI